VNAIKPLINSDAARRIKATDITHINNEFVLAVAVVVVIAIEEGFN